MIKDMHNLPSRRLCHAISQRAPCRQPDHRPATTAEAAEEAYSDHTSNEYSHRLHEEDVTHRMNISSIRYEYRKDGDKKKFDRAMKKEQHRHPFLPAQPCAGFRLGNCEPLRLPRLRLLAESPAFCYTRSCIYRKKAPAIP